MRCRRSTWFTRFLTSRTLAWCCALLLFAGAAFGLSVDARILSSLSGRATAVAGRITGSRNPDLVIAFARQAPALQPRMPPPPLWHPAPEDGLSASVPLRRLVSLRYRTLRLDQDVLIDVLAQTPIELPDAARDTRVEIDLPWPDGSFRRFRIEESSIIEPVLAAQFPELKTYRGQGIDDPTASARIDWTPSGFHAMVLSAQGTIYVEPYAPGDTRHYIVYDKRDYRRGNAQPFRDEVILPAGQAAPASLLQPLRGDSLRTYRLAVAATGEYTAAHGGTVARAMNSIVTTMNRVNGIYERDFAVRMILVGNNSSIVYTNASTDPYTNNNAIAMLCENARNLDAVIGAANYDIGHVFATQTGGGVAARGVVCNSANACGVRSGSEKGRGVTGSLSPQGDPFDVDYVAHEMGHQFGAEHTFNGTTRGCGLPNSRKASMAFEPGSGSTIMGYAGPAGSTKVCGSESLQDNSDAYFHAATQDQVIAFIAGAGGSCAVSSATGNSPPTVNAGTDYTIPHGTPFTLTATGTDADGDYLLYTWEEMDLGPPSPPNTDDGSRPIFRSFPPTPSPSRTFPKLSDILNNTSTLGESLPTTTRAMKFRVTVRDNRLGGGGTASDDIVLNVRSDSGPFSVTYPNTGVAWTTGSKETVTWNVVNTSQAPVNAANVKISLSTDGGNTFPVVLAASTPNDGSEEITIPHFATMSARLKIEAVGNVFFDVSNANFTINPSAPALSIDDVTVAEGNFGTAAAIFTVSVSPPSASTVTVAYTTANGTATAPSDYAFTSGTLAFAPGSSSATIAVSVNGDVTNEASETLLVNLSSPVNATMTDGQGIGTITNDEASIAPAAIVDGTFEAGSPWPAWTIQSSTVFGAPLCDTATCGTDFGPFDGRNWAYFGGANYAETSTLGQTVTFPLASSLALQFQMRIATATGFEPPDPLVVSVDGTTVQTFTNAELPESAYSLRQVDLTPFADGRSHTLRFSYTNVPRLSHYATYLVDNVELVATAPTLAINDVSVLEDDLGTTTARFTVTLSPPRASTVSVAYTTADGTAAAGSDYVASSSVVTFLPGQTTQTINVVVNGDATFEPTESFLVNLSGATNATITDGQGVGTIINDEGTAPTAGFGDGAFEAGRPYSAWTVQSSTNYGTPLCDTSVCGTSGGTAGPFGGTNWAWFGGATAHETSSIGQAVVLPRSNSLTLRFQMRVGHVTAPATDTLVVSVDGVRVHTFTEPDSAEAAYSLRQIDLTPFADGAAHALLFTYDGPTSGSANFSVDNIELFSSSPTLPSVSIDDVVVPESSSGTTTASFTVTLSATSAQTVTVGYATANGTATAGSDYTAASGTVAFAPGTTMRRVDVTVNGDTRHEADETFVVNLLSPTNATILDSQGVGTIHNDDAIPSATIDNVTVSEGHAGITNATFTVTLSAASSQQVMVDYVTSNGTATTAGSDYTTTSGTLTFAAGVTSQRISVPVIGDTTIEPDEIFFVNLGGAVNLTIDDGNGTAAILNDDPSLTVDDVTLYEGHAGTTNATFTVTLSAASSQQVTVDYLTGDGTATTAGNDYVATSGRLTFAPGVTAQSISVPVTGDTAVEPDETFVVTLSNAVNATIAKGTGTGTILNDD
jgi:Metallo-peptidase family M12B Reprolysin-like/Calx-beta domain